MSPGIQNDMGYRPVEGSSMNTYHTHHYHTQVNNIEQVHNANLAPNHGQIIQSSFEDLVVRAGEITLTFDNLHPSLHPIPDASHTRNRRVSPPDSSCLPGTRKVVLEKIRAWAWGGDADGGTRRVHISSFPPGSSGNKHIFWLCGPVGCGKSAISQAVADEFHDNGRLLGSFFFFRGSAERSKIAKLAVTLANQMSGTIPATTAAIRSALYSDSSGLSAASVRNQFQRLVYQPLEKVFMPAAGSRAVGNSKNLWALAPFIIVIDGLDECEDREEVAELIEDMLNYFKKTPNSPVRFFIASRIEEHIRSRISGQDEVLVENLHDRSSRDDITTVVWDAFRRAAENNMVIRALGGNGRYPLMSTGSSSTPMIHDGLTPMERFGHSLKMNPGLDGLYTTTLRRCHRIPYFGEVVFSLCLLQDGLSITGLAELLNIPSYRVIHALVPLQSIIHVPGDDRSSVTLFHTSLRDFLSDERRSGSIISSASRIEYLQCFLMTCFGRCCIAFAEPMRAMPSSLTLDEWQSFCFHFLGKLTSVDNWQESIRRKICIVVRAARQYISSEIFQSIFSFLANTLLPPFQDGEFLTDFLAERLASLPRSSMTFWVSVYFKMATLPLVSDPSGTAPLEPPFHRWIYWRHEYRSYTVTPTWPYTPPSHEWTLFQGMIKDALHDEQVGPAGGPNSVHMAVVMHGMRRIFQHSRANQATISQGWWGYFLVNWARHLSLAISRCPIDEIDALGDFLASPCLEKTSQDHWIPPGIHSPGNCPLGHEFPDILDSCHIEETPPCNHTTHAVGVRIIDLLLALDKLRISGDALPDARKRVDICFPDDTILTLSSWNGGEGKTCVYYPWYHLDHPRPASIGD
ncbi:hypothetical protein NMY22_g6335 [Coprinellus aureogranulatus]|nr:hypothetical protein NMY22_g6335 [Coprinellus aureogranulatus]